MRTIAREEVIGVIGWATALIVMTGLPYALAASRGGPRQHFSGFLWGVDEGNVYLSWIRQYQEGAWVVANQFTIRHQEPRFLNLFLLVLGRMCHYFKLQPIEAFHIARMLGIPFTLYAFYCMVAHLTAVRRIRVAALLVASTGSGLGWLFTLLAYTGRQATFFPIDCGSDWQVLPEGITFLSLLLNPLFTWSLGLMCAALLWAWRALENDSARQAVIAGLLLLLLGNIHSYDVFAVHAAIILWGACLAFRRSLSLKRAVLLYAIIWVIAFPSVAWAWYSAHADPCYMAKVNTPTLSPRVRDYAAGYGLLGIAALVGAYCAWFLRTRHPRSFAVVLWAAATLLLAYAPVSFQRKMVEGLHLALAYLAALAVALAIPYLFERRWPQSLSPNTRHRRRTRLVTALTVFFVVLTAPSNVLFVYDALQHVAVNYADLRHVLMPPVYLTDDEVNALRWLAAHTSPTDVVLSSSLIGNHIPAWSPAKVVAGHWAETLDFPAAVRTVATFYAPGLMPDARRRILADTGATYVWWGQYERFIQSTMVAVAEKALGARVPLPDPPGRTLPELRIAFAAGDVIIYRVQSDATR